jgi:polyphenol oxidase
MMLSFIHPDWPAPANVGCASTMRHGGVSGGRYASLNLGKGSGDDPAAVDENRRRVFQQLQLPAPPSWIRQVHGTQVVRAPFAAGAQSDPEADACFTTTPGVVCLVQTADCLPVLFCDDAGSVVAAAHAGWRGLAAGVLENTVKTLPVAPDRLMAWLGPAIGPEAFEVGSEVRQAFLRSSLEAVAAFKPGARRGKWLCDLSALARLRLRAAGVDRVFGGGPCTHANPERFFSFRRDGECGRMASLIWLR